MVTTRLATGVAGAAAGGLAIVAGATVVDGPSEATATTAEILRFQGEHGGQMQLSVVATALAGLALLAFAAGVVDLLRDHRGLLPRLAGVAAAATGVLLLAAAAPRTVLLREDLGGIDPGVLAGWYALNDLTDMITDAAVVTAAVMVGAFGVVAVRHGLPRPLGWAGGVLGVGAPGAVLAPFDGPVDGPFVVVVSAIFMLWPLWMIASGLALAIRRAPEPVPARSGV